MTDNQARGGVSEAEVDWTAESLSRSLNEARLERGWWAQQAIRLAQEVESLKSAAQVRAGQDPIGEVTEMVGEVERLRTVLDWHKRQLRVTQDALAIAGSTQAAAEARAAKAVEVLRHVEWAENYGLDANCPVCLKFRRNGHAPRCSLATLLSDHPAPEPGVEAGEVRRAALEAIDDYAHSKILNGPRYSGETREWEAGATHGFRHAMIAVRDRIRALQTPANGGRDGK